jgi:hypothetical protein
MVEDIGETLQVVNAGHVWELAEGPNGRRAAVKRSKAKSGGKSKGKQG